MTKLRAGDWVEVRRKEQILRSLDKHGRLEGLPFMPQMFQYCGQQFRVYKRAHKTCDTVNETGGRWLTNAVHLDLRCDGKAYGGCQAACLIFWKESWLMPIGDRGTLADESSAGSVRRTNDSSNGTGCSEHDVWAATRAQDQREANETRYVCQATQLPYFTTSLPWWHIKQYVEDYTSGNTTLRRIFSGLVFAFFNPLCRSGRPQLEALRLPFRWLYNRFQAVRGGRPFPRMRGTRPPDQLVPISSLNLQPGELVRVRSHEEIRATIGLSNRHLGLFFDAEMVPYCGGLYRVRARVSKFIDEKTGRMKSMTTPAVILETVWCRSRYSDCRLFCPRSIYSWWREVWLERVPEGEDRKGIEACIRNTEPRGGRMEGAAGRPRASVHQPRDAAHRTGNGGRAAHSDAAAAVCGDVGSG
jgi:hypothetical protein